MTRFAPVLVAALLVLAGCGSFVPGNGSGERTETLTPVPVTASPTETSTQTPSRSAFPGIDENGRIDGRAVFGAHERTLANRSYTLVRVREASGGSGAIGADREERVLVANNSTFLASLADEQVDGTQVRYADPTGLYVRHVRSNGTVETLTDGRPDDAARVRFAGAVFYETDSMLVPGATDVSVVERDDQRYARFFTQRPPERLERIYDDFEVRNFSATLYAAAEGYVRAVYYEYDLHDDDRRVHVEWRTRYEAVGETTVAEPNWVRAVKAGEDARNLTATVAVESPGENETAAPEAAEPGTTPANGTAAPAPTRTAGNGTAADE